MASALGNLIQFLNPKAKSAAGGRSHTPTFRSQQTTQVLSFPAYREHLTDIFASRQADDSRDLMQFLFKNDPDVSAAVFSYLTMANTQIRIYARGVDGAIDREATKALDLILLKLTRPMDYTKGFQLRPNLSRICEELRYMLLLRGTIAAELVFDKKAQPDQIRVVDPATLEWYEAASGDYKPRQRVSGSNTGIDLDIPQFFVNFFRRDPTSVYTTSLFVSAINTIAARQQIINDLYRIMQQTGYPRMAVKVYEEVLRKNIPPAIVDDQVQRDQWVAAQIQQVSSSIQSLRPQDTFVHTDSVEPYVINEDTPGVSVDISKIIETLNSQNQAGLKTMATVIGRGTSGVNTGSVEARIAAMNADEVNVPIAELLSDILSMALHVNGYQAFVEVSFAPAELRPDLELEAQRTMRAARLRKDLSDGLITDDEYHMMMYNRIRPETTPILSGTKFLAGDGMVDATGVSPNSDPLGRSLTSQDASYARSDAAGGGNA